MYIVLFGLVKLFDLLTADGCLLKLLSNKY